MGLGDGFGGGDMGQWGDEGWRVVEGWGGGFGRRDMGVGGDVGLMEEWGGVGGPADL